MCDLPAVFWYPDDRLSQVRHLVHRQRHAMAYGQAPTGFPTKRGAGSGRGALANKVKPLFPISPYLP